MLGSSKLSSSYINSVNLASAASTGVTLLFIQICIHIKDLGIAKAKMIIASAIAVVIAKLDLVI